MKLGFIGTGTIASAVVRAIAPDGHQIVVSERGTKHSTELATAFDNVAATDNQGVLDAADVIFLGLLATHAPRVLGDLRFRADHRVISFMAALGLDQVAALIAPARAAAIMMPFPAVAKGGSPIIMLGDEALVREIFGATNAVCPLADDRALNAYLAAQAVLSPIAKIVANATGWLAAQGSDPVDADAFLRALVTSSLAETDAGALIAAFNTQGGYNQRLRQHMQAAGIDAALTAGLDALYSERAETQSKPKYLAKTTLGVAKPLVAPGARPNLNRETE